MLSWKATLTQVFVVLQVVLLLLALLLVSRMLLDLVYATSSNRTALHVENKFAARELQLK